MLQYETIPVTPFQQNCSVVWCDETMRGAIIDPGGDLDMLLDGCKQLGVTLEQIWITHAHIDHAGGTAELAERLKLPIIGPHEGDQFWIDGLAPTASQVIASAIWSVLALLLGGYFFVSRERDFAVRI